MMPTHPADLRERAAALHLNGLLANWSAVAQAPWLRQLLDWEDTERARRSLERRLRSACIGQFKSLAAFDWAWPARCERSTIEELQAHELLEELMRLEFLEDATNVILIGPNGVGKTTIAQNLAHQALVRGHKVRFASAGQLLGELAALDSASTLSRRLRHYASVDLLCIDEVGYLSYSNRHADLLFELTNRRYEKRSTILTTNRPFSEWAEVFPNAACVVSLVDRLTHHAEIVPIEGQSYRLHEAQLRNEQRAQKRRQKKP